MREGVLAELPDTPHADLKDLRERGEASGKLTVALFRESCDQGFDVRFC